MLITDLLEETYSALSMNKARSGLTVLGIVIGISSVVAMIAIGQGAQGQIESNIEGMGSNLITVYPGSTQQNSIRGGMGSAQTLTMEDAEAIEEIESVEAVAPEISRSYQVVAGSSNTNTRVLGTTPSYTQVKKIEVETGSFVSDQNLQNSSKVAVLGPDTSDDLFGEGVNPVGQRIKINQVSFTVIGATESKGSSGGGMSQDDIIFIPITTAQRFLSGDDYVTTINVQAKNQDSMTIAQEEVTNLLLMRHNISDPQLADFGVYNQTDLIETFSSVANTFTVLLAAIASISLLVGGIGIMNMMLTTVTERTREIGLRKSIGAKNKEITLQFLSESIALTFIGGIVGTFLGWIISILITKFAGIAATVSISSVLLAFGVSAAIGISFGYYPARKAARLNPIEALRYE